MSGTGNDCLEIKRDRLENLTFRQLKNNDSFAWFKESIQICCLCRRRMGFSLQLLRDEIVLRAETTIRYSFWFGVILQPRYQDLSLIIWDEPEVLGSFRKSSR